MKISDIKIIKAGEEEILELHAISQQTFFETFANDNTSEDMELYLENNLSITKLQQELNNPDSEFYLAKQDKNVIGYLKLNKNTAQTEIKDKKSTEIERIYVLKEFQGHKIGQILFNTAYNLSHQNGSEFIWLGVWEKNIRAINFYQKNGFVEFDKHIFKLGSDEQTDVLMRLKLT